MKKVFLYEIKKMIIPYAIFLGLMSIICFSFMLSSTRSTYADFVGMMSAFMIILMFGIIFYSFSYNKRRISADMNYSLPVTKRQLFLGKYLASMTGLLGLSILFLGICYIVFGIASGLDKIYLHDIPLSEQAVRLFISSLLRFVLCIPLFNFCLLFFYKANSIIDGIIYIVLGNVMVYLVAEVISLVVVDYPYLSSLPLFVFTHGINNLIYNLSISSHTKEYTFYTTLYSFYGLIGYSLIIYLLWWTKKDSAIRTQEISDGIFGYKVFLPALGFLIMFQSFVSSRVLNGMSVSGIVFIIEFILISVGLFIGYCIYHRSLKFTKSSYIALGVVMMINLILMLVV